MPDQPTYFIDRCLGKTVARRLSDAGASIELHDDHFAQQEQDEVWIRAVAARGWVILTKDKNIRRRLGEREALLLSNARVISLTSGNMTGAAMGDLLSGSLQAIDEFVASTSPPFLASLHVDGSLHLLTLRPLEDLPPEGSSG